MVNVFKWTHATNWALLEPEIELFPTISAPNEFSLQPSDAGKVPLRLALVMILAQRISKFRKGTAEHTWI